MADDQVLLDAPPEAPAQRWIVAVGASAGGLEALERFFGALHVPTHAAFVVIQHLMPDHRSLMGELLGRQTSLPVLTAEPGVALESDHIYLMPPGVTITLEDDRLAFQPRPPQGLSLPIDVFFRSMAHQAPERSIGVVLSGSGTDGSSGAPLLREAGGYVLVQSPDSAKFDSMPKCTLAAGPVDGVGLPEDLALRVVALSSGQAARVQQGEIITAPSAKPALQALMDRLLQHSGIDFTLYKMATVMRRIERRMATSNCGSLAEYAALVESSADECETLRRELLIPVTSFFRDPETFAALRPLLRSLVMDAPEGKPLRIWCAGCATGQEAYSLAIEMAEVCHEAQRWPGYKIFATDVDQCVLDVAATGRYAIAELDSVPVMRRDQFFSALGDHATVRPEVRQKVLFARHNLLDDPPFTRIDLITCRNTLIYFQAAAQERVLRRLQYALNVNGLLLLGSSESPGTAQADFLTLDASNKLFQLVRPVMTTLAVQGGFGLSPVAPLRARRPEQRLSSLPDVVEHSTALLMQSYVPLTLLVNEQRQLLHAWGPTQTWLRVPEGSPALDAIRLLPSAVALLTVHALRSALNENSVCRTEPIQIDLEGKQRTVRIVARPVDLGPDLGLPSRYVLITLEECEALTLPTLPGEAALAAQNNTQLAFLESELARLRRSNQASVEELEAANEELQATNEELMSSNEELQSTNEELQSVNEELHTVNAEFNSKLDVVTSLNADLEGMSAATGVATLFFDHQLTLVRFTPEAALLFRLRPTDLGRPIEDFANRLHYDDLIGDLRCALGDDTLIEREVQGPDHTWLLARVLGYGAPSARERRAVLSLTDISRVRDANRLQRLIDSLPEHVAVLDTHGTIRMVNDSWKRFACANGDASGKSTGIGVNYLAVLARSEDPDCLTTLSGLKDVMGGRRDSFSMTYPCDSPQDKRWFIMHVQRLAPPEEGLVVTHFDITPWKLDEVASDRREPPMPN